MSFSWDGPNEPPLLHKLIIVNNIDAIGDMIDDADRDALFIAAYYGRYEIVKLLLGGGAYTRWNKIDALERAVARGHLDIVQELLHSGAAYNQTRINDMLICAAECNNRDIMVELIHVGADCRALDDKALRRAAVRGHTDVVIELIYHGADVNVVDWFGYNPLHLACYNNHVDTARVLIRMGSKIQENLRERIPYLNKDTQDVLKLSLTDHIANWLTRLLFKVLKMF